MKIHKRNLYHIKRVFEEKTGAALLRDSDAKPSWDKELTPEEPHSSRKWIPKIAVIAAVITCFVTLAAFGVSIFSTLGGDRLVMTASYAGRGIVWVEITNQSEKNTEFRACDEALLPQYAKAGSGNRRGPLSQQPIDRGEFHTENPVGSAKNLRYRILGK